MTNLPKPVVTPTLGITCIAANTSDIIVIRPRDVKSLRIDIANYAPRAYFHVCYYHPNRRVWYSIYGRETKSPMLFKSPFLTKDEAEALWSKAEAMCAVTTREQNKLNEKGEAKVIDFPRDCPTPIK